MRRLVLMQGWLALVLVLNTGCSTLGLTLWPAQFPLLTQTKEFAAQSPLPSGLPHELAKTVVPDYFVEPGDRVLIEPIALDSAFRMSGDQEVMVDGSVDLGEFGRIRVAGMTVEMIENAIEDRIAQLSGEREAINVQLIETNASEIYVLGEVGSPGAYALNGRETVLDAIVMAGGLTNRASPCDMILVRPTAPGQCRVVQPVCYRQITQLGDVTSNYQLQPGDRVVVGSRTLCEELAFWKQTSPCERCSRSRCVECQPATVGYTNRFSNWLVAFPLPRKFSGMQEEVLDGAAETRGAVPGNVDDRYNAPAPTSPTAPAPLERATEPDDSDLFLPPVTPGETQSRNATTSPYWLEAGTSSRLGNAAVELFPKN